MQFAPDVERWRATVAQYVPAQYVDKVLWTINYESGGNPAAVGDNGKAVGLLQVQNDLSFSGRPTTEQLLNPAFNIQYAATQLGINQGNFAAWGENNTYNGSVFGALGNHPYPGNTTPDPNAGDTTLGIPGTPIGVDVNNIPGVGDALGGVLDWNKNVVQGAADAATASLGVLKQVGQGLAWLLDPHHWFRLFFIAAGLVLVVVGAHMYVRGGDAVKDYERVGLGAMAA